MKSNGNELKSEVDAAMALAELRSHAPARTTTHECYSCGRCGAETILCLYPRHSVCRDCREVRSGDGRNTEEK